MLSLNSRFCRKPYEPFDPSDTDRYVLYGADHIPIWEVRYVYTIYYYSYMFEVCHNIDNPLIN